jgi:hypothetical protein
MMNHIQNVRNQCSTSISRIARDSSTSLINKTLRGSFFAVATIFTTPAHAQLQNHSIVAFPSQQAESKSTVPFCCQVWSLNFVRGQIDQAGKWDYYLELQPRADFEDSNRNRILMRPALVYNLNQTESIWAGILHQTDGYLNATEFRTWQQYQRVDQSQKVIILNRTRLEQRFKQGESDIGLRIRHMLRAQIPAGEESQWSVVLFDELFLGLNENASQKTRGFDQNRAFGGLRYDLENKAFVEFGILNQITGDEVYNIPLVTLGKTIKRKKRVTPVR